LSFLLFLLTKFLKLAHGLDRLLIQNGISPWRVARAAELFSTRGDALSLGKNSVPSTHKRNPKKNSAWDRTDDLWV